MNKIKINSILSDSDLGGERNPVSNNKQLQSLIIEKNLYDTVIYTIGTWKINDDVLRLINNRRIILSSLAFAILPGEEVYYDLKRDVLLPKRCLAILEYGNPK